MKAYEIIVLAILCLGGLWTCAPRTYSPVVVRPASCSDDIQFAESPQLGYLLQFADKMQKPVFIDFYSPWIESCSRMDKLVFTNDELAKYFNTHFINYKVNAGDSAPGSHLATMYGVTMFPTLMFIDGKGKMMLKHEGPATAAQLLEMGMYLHQATDETQISIGSR